MREALVIGPQMEGGSHLRTMHRHHDQLLEDVADFDTMFFEPSAFNV